MNHTNATSLSAVQFGSERLLPFDIVKAIFSFIDQSDCLECMLVSQSWFQAVPQYAGLVWETVNFTKSKVNSQRFWMCLGPHVRRIILTDDIHAILDKLIQHNCCYIETIKFNRCQEITRHIPEIHHFNSALYQLSPKGLEFHKINCDLPIMEILAACPKLQNFSCSFSKSFRRENADSWGDSLKMTTFSADPTLRKDQMVPKLNYLTSLRLDVRMDEIITIVKQCPSLSTLHLWLQWPGLRNHDINIIDLNHIFKVCPRLDQLLCYWPDREELSKYHWKGPDNNTSSFSSETSSSASNNVKINRDVKKPIGQLKSFSSSVVLGHGPKEIVRLIKQNQPTLECIKIVHYDLNNNNIIEDFEFAHQAPTAEEMSYDWQQLSKIKAEQLVELSTRDLPWKNNTLASFLSHCPSLTYLSLQNLDPTILEIKTNTRQQPRRRNNNGSHHHHHDQNSDTHVGGEFALHKAFGLLPHLKSVELLLNTKLLTRATTQHLCTLLHVMSDTAPHLEQLCVAGFHVITDQLLEAAANYRHLRTLRLGHGDIFRRNRPTTEKGIQTFVERLSQQIRFLDLTNLKLSSRTLFEELANRPDLNLLTLNSCGKTDEIGLRTFLTHKATVLEFLRMDSCHIEHRKELVQYAKDELCLKIRENRNQLLVSRTI